MDSYELKGIVDAAKKGNREKKKKELLGIINSEHVANRLSGGDIMPIQLLLLHYLGIIDNIPGSNENKSRLLSIILKTNGAENIRKLLSNLKSIKNEKNLEIVSEILESLKFGDAEQLIARDRK